MRRAPCVPLPLPLGPKNQNIHQNPLALLRVNARGISSPRASCVDACGMHAERNHPVDAAIVINNLCRRALRTPRQPHPYRLSAALSAGRKGEISAPRSRRQFALVHDEGAALMQDVPRAKLVVVQIAESLAGEILVRGSRRMPGQSSFAMSKLTLSTRLPRKKRQARAHVRPGRVHGAALSGLEEQAEAVVAAFERGLAADVFPCSARAPLRPEDRNRRTDAADRAAPPQCPRALRSTCRSACRKRFRSYRRRARHARFPGSGPPRPSLRLRP